MQTKLLQTGMLKSWYGHFGFPQSSWGHVHMVHTVIYALVLVHILP